ncbi:MAG: hypothetical protein AAF572_07615 [Cyanobacteria bacterium P01_B01_bin.77]
MTFITPDSVISKENQPKGKLVRALDWFIRFSQFYGDYQSLAPKDRNRWVKELQR